jgi:AAHS family 4-hydroxybenzoate transporter-like MFS transporter
MEMRKVNVYDLIDSRRVGRAQYLIIAFCALIMLFDGFDIQVISFIVPVLAKEWHLPKSVIGSIFSAVFFGLLIGNFGIPFLIQRLGTKKMAFIATASFGIFTVLTVAATNVPELIGLRVLAGIGLGSATPCAVGLISEFSPRRTRATFVVWVYMGYAIGFVVAGFCSNALIPSFGWQGPLWLGGVAALVISVLVIPFLPESAAFLSKRGRQTELLRVSKRLFPEVVIKEDEKLITREQKMADSGMRGLFSSRLCLGTFLLWAVFACTLAAFFFLQNWLPTILTSVSFPAGLVVWATASVVVGGMVASLLLAPLMDRTGPYKIMTTLYVFGAISMYAISIAINSSYLVLLMIIFCCGFCISGGATLNIALCSLFYPPALRAPGVAWAYGCGRLGAAGGTYLAGVLYAHDWTPDDMFRVAAVPVLVVAVCIAVMGVCHSQTRKSLEKTFST